jgi:hypothetical protein
MMENWRFALVGALSVLALSSNAALACKGTNTLLRDDFTDEDPAWGIADTPGAAIGDGSLKIASEPSHGLRVAYQGMNFPDGDACVDVVAPGAAGKSPTIAGIGLQTARGWNYVYVGTEGTAGVEGLQANAWVNPVPSRKFDAVRSGPGAVNNIRVVWKGPPQQNDTAAPDPTVQVFINGKLFVKFKLPPNGDRQLALYAESEGGTYVFKNLNVTD